LNPLRNHQAGLPRTLPDPGVNYFAIVSGIGVAKTVAERRSNAMHREIAGPLKSDPQTSPGAPNNPTALLRASEKQFKSIRQPGLVPNLKTGAAGGIVYDSAINDGNFRANDQLGHIGFSACWSNASKPSRIHHRPLLGLEKPASNFADYAEYFEHFVQFYGY
jgi:hypothetical protein